MSGAAAAQGRRVLVLGGSSEIAAAIVAEMQAHAPRSVALLGRDGTACEAVAARLRELGCEAVVQELEALETATHGHALERAVAALGGVDTVVLAVGELGPPGAVPSELEAAVSTLQVNTTGAGSLLLHAAALLRERGGGTIVVLSSVAAQRPRRANAVYGASKAGLDALARGIGDDLQDDGVRVLVVRPGFVRTRMTAGMQPAPLACDPEDVARAVYAALGSRAQTIWVPGPLRWVMLVMGLLPRPIFRRLRR